MSNAILLIFSITTSIFFGTFLYLLLRKKLIAKSLAISLSLSMGLCLVFYWLLTSAIPTHNAKKRILHYTKDQYPIKYNQIDIIERSPGEGEILAVSDNDCLLYTSPSPRDATLSRMPSSA